MAASGGKVDMNDPQVRKLVYSMYRGILGSYNDQANTALVTGPEKKIVQDKGVYDQIESMARSLEKSTRHTGDSSSVGSQAVSSPPAAQQFTTFPSSDVQATANNSTSVAGGTAPPAPPPPPPPLPTELPTGRVTSQLSGRAGNASMNQHRDVGGGGGDGKSNPGSGAPFSYMPPAAIQSAMTKDKKPFTYTPAGIDLSEIRSPRMAKRIQQNAMAEGSLAPPPPTPPHEMLPNRPGEDMTSPPPPPPPPPMPDLMSQPMVKLPSFTPPKPCDFPQLKPTAHHAGNKPVPGGGSTAGAQISVNGNASTGQRQQPLQRPFHQQKSLPVIAIPHNSSLSGADHSTSWTDRDSASSGVGSLYIPPVSSSDSSSSSGTRNGNALAQAPTQATSAALKTAPLPWMTSKMRQNSSPVIGAGTRNVPILIDGQVRSPPPPPPPLSSLASPSPSNVHVYTRGQCVVEIPVQVRGNAMERYHQQAQELSQGLDNLSISQQEQQPDSGQGEPIQSRSFRVLQKLTSEDAADGVPVPGMALLAGQPNLELSEDDKQLMNHVRDKVNDENYLHDEADPRYRGAYIPSRAFRMLQDMTSKDLPLDVQQRNYRAEAASTVAVPQSHWRTDTSQTPSRSFRLLQQMTATEPNHGPKPGQSDF